MEAAKTGDLAQVRSMLAVRSELVSTDTSGGDEHRAIHHAVLRRDPAMVRLLMEAGADARKGIFPHRDATSAFALARDREYSEILAIIEEEERHRREELSCVNATVTPQQDEISAAIARGDTDTAIALLETDLSQIQACDRTGKTPLHVAAATHNISLVRWLIERRAKVRKPDADGRTPIDSAARAPGNVRPIADLLLANGADLTISAAVALGIEDTVRESIAADPSALRRSGRSGGLLTIAVKHRQLAMARLLLDLGADVDERTLLEELEVPTESWGMPLWHAALVGDLPMTQLLLDRGADPNANVYASGWPLRNAWDHPDSSVKDLLIARGARVQPYMIAETHDVDGARRLLESDPVEQVVHELVWSAADSECPEILRLALPHLSWPRDDPRWHWVLTQPMRDEGGDTALETMRTLLDHGIDPNVSRFGHTALHYAAGRRGGLTEEDRARFASLLTDFGADLSIRDDLLKSTALGWACRWGRKKMVELLLSCGASADEPDAEPWARPAVWASKMGHAEILALLQ